MLKHTVKAAEVSHLTDARYFAAWEVAYLGFPIGRGGLSLAELDAIRSWVEGPKIVGEWSGISPLPTAEELAAYRLDALQLSPFSSPLEVATAAQVYGLPIWVEYTPEAPCSMADLQEFISKRASFVQCFVFNFSKAGLSWQDLLSGDALSLKDLQELTANYPILLDISGGSPSSIHQALPFLEGFSLRGGEEEKVGYKDFDALADFFEDLEVL